MDEDFDDWYRKLRVEMAPALAAWCGDVSTADDAIDEAFVRALERWERVRSCPSPAGWVWRTATNLVRRHHRRRMIFEGRRNGSQELLSEVSEDSGIDVDLYRALRALSERQRAAVVLHYYADLSQHDVGRVLGIAPGTVAATLHQARARLGELLDEGPVGRALTITGGGQ